MVRIARALVHALADIVSVYPVMFRELTSADSPEDLADLAALVPYTAQRKEHP